ncbi:hypothetical protein [Chondromyces crocatus]|uniref:Lipoprotein n=1 Tax=Chondromyces crocatus TaxID=52 RepID=A0A0K1EHV2_CHOCO|nr:hypothetical protein [Chondromyces crocatus]AKT40262.1 uncharacterized protein CMC5_044150 [Chondromyces crocatus]
MLTPRNLRRALGRATLLGSLAAVTASCGGLGPGDYVGYRVASSEAKLDASCYPGGKIPDAIKDDTTTFRTGATFLLYIASDEEAFLDTGTRVIAGTVDGDNFNFSGTRTDVEYPPGQTIFDSDGNGIDDDQQTFVDADRDGLNDKTEDPQVDVNGDGIDDRTQVIDEDGDGIDDRRVDLPSGIKFISSSTVTVTLAIDGSAVVGDVKTTIKNECTGATCPLNYDSSCSNSASFKGVEIDDVDISIGAAPASSAP